MLYTVSKKSPFETILIAICKDSNIANRYAEKLNSERPYRVGPQGQKFYSTSVEYKVSEILEDSDISKLL